MSEILEKYIKKYSVSGSLIKEEPLSSLELVITVPVYNEKVDLVQELCYSLLKNKFKGDVEVIFLVNEQENSDERIRKNNKEVISFIKDFKKMYQRNDFIIHGIYIKDIPVKYAGVGFARKMVMDEGVRRFLKIKKEHGIISSLDADCIVKDNYISEILRAFSFQKLGIAHVYFEHRYDDINYALRRGIVYYELFLRFYKNSLKFALYPFATYTISSCMVIRAKEYAKHCGIKKKKKAGEDFYFFQKVLPFTYFSDIVSTSVLPYARVSDRVPFGTGKALKDFIEGKEKIYYQIPFKVFKDIRILFETLRYLEDISYYSKWLKELPFPLKTFVKENKFYKFLKKSQESTRIKKLFLEEFFLFLTVFFYGNI